MKRISYQLTLLSAIVIAIMFSSCVRKVVLEDDHRHPHIHKAHPHERAVQEHTDVNIR